MVAKDERVENYDFLIWSGLLSKFEKATRVSSIKILTAVDRLPGIVCILGVSAAN